MSALELDDTDERIIALLREDGRMSYRALASELDLTEATIRSRVRRMEASNAMRVVAVTDFRAAGYELMLAVGIQVDDRPPLEVAEALAEIPEVFSINIVIGAHDIETLVVARDQADLSQLIYERLARLPGVKRVFPSLAIDVLKNQPDSVPFYKTAKDPASIESGGATSPAGSELAGASDVLSEEGGGAMSPSDAEPAGASDEASAREGAL